MLSIGEFSKLCEVSTKTLRYYDEIGLITPDEINPDNGYRYYAVRQLKTMLMISRLKSYHFSLEEIKAILKAEPDDADERLGAALHRKRQDMQVRLGALERTLRQMNADLANLARGIPLLAYVDRIDVQLATVPPMTIASTRLMIRGEDYDAGYGAFFARLYERIAAEGLTLAGTPMTIYHSSEYNPSGNDTEFAIPVEEAGDGTRELPGRLCARAVLKGAYPELQSVYARLREWIEEEGYVVADAPYEVYLTDPKQVNDAAESVTEVYFPIRKN
ncbi:MerR family transcriptional regulator [Paenibacillus methanolicus]|uniref:DNA-binding transcriptional MerR regulator n=1 Tax=Paenibacillus methanolicus TaxID=582686 RepID=A0A5S5C957_9BACL|nr:MerR family transcriptional regulator [Paenibacillus methanolicus]TYP74860.1 DNA-binding transcriptional MerR regulator [Paenibacillus methanolicus]